jgi:hypothetical protein
MAWLDLGGCMVQVEKGGMYSWGFLLYGIRYGLDK